MQGATASRRREPVLIIDHDERSARYFTELVAGLGFETRRYRSATRVELSELRAAPFAILDLSIPGMDGIDFMTMLAAVGIDTPLVLSSRLPRRTLEGAGAAGRASRLNIAGLLHRPFPVREFQRVVGAALSLREERPVGPGPGPDPVAAFDRGALRAHFQPKVNLADGQIIGFESLARLALEDGRILAPNAFLPELDAAGRLGVLSDRMLELALHARGRWPGRRSPLHVAVNLPARHLEATDFPERVRALLERTRTPAGCLCLEITESEFIEADSVAFESLVRLALLGVHLSVDDFGTGFSSFEQIHKLPCDELKIDRSFVQDLDREEHAETIVRNTVELARELGLTVTAEGIELPLQAEILQLMGCQLGQGFLYGRPEPEPVP